MLWGQAELLLEKKSPPRKPYISMLIGAFIGFYSGIVGIGGGIFLAPVLYRLRWGGAQAIAAACSLFILVNSLAGLAGQLTKLPNLTQTSELLSYWPLILAVLIGGTWGNMFSIRFFFKWANMMSYL